MQFVGAWTLAEQIADVRIAWPSPKSPIALYRFGKVVGGTVMAARKWICKSVKCNLSHLSNNASNVVSFDNFAVKTHSHSLDPKEKHPGCTEMTHTKWNVKFYWKWWEILCQSNYLCRHSYRNPLFRNVQFDLVRMHLNDKHQRTLHRSHRVYRLVQRW